VLSQKKSKRTKSASNVGTPPKGGSGVPNPGYKDNDMASAALQARVTYWKARALAAETINKKKAVQPEHYTIEWR